MNKLRLKDLGKQAQKQILKSRIAYFRRCIAEDSEIDLAHPNGSVVSQSRISEFEGKIETYNKRLAELKERIAKL